jgi:hypothetical protein
MQRFFGGRMRLYLRVAGLALATLSAGLTLLHAQDASPPSAQTSPQPGLQTPPPLLHKRSEPKDDNVRSYSNPQVPSSLPSEASGEYQLGKPGDVIEIILDNNGLTGYISMLGKSDHDKEVPLTYFFDETQLNAQTLSFTTKPVHGEWYSFEGTVIRGPAPSRDKEGYYLLKGRLTLHSGQAEQPRNVALPLARAEVG